MRGENGKYSHIQFSKNQMFYDKNEIKTIKTQNNEDSKIYLIHLYNTCGYTYSHFKIGSKTSNRSFVIKNSGLCPISVFMMRTNYCRRALPVSRPIKENIWRAGFSSSHLGFVFGAVDIRGLGATPEIPDSLGNGQCEVRPFTLIVVEVRWDILQKIRIYDQVLKIRVVWLTITLYIYIWYLRWQFYRR